MRRLKYYTWLFKILFGIAAFRRRGRATHRWGVGSSGTLKIEEKPTFSEHSFFVAGKSFPVTLRHASMKPGDDATLDVRGAALRIGDSDGSEFLDLPMNTGITCLFWNAVTLKDFMLGAALGRIGWKWFRRRYPKEYQAGVDGMRRSPSSFAELYYHSQIVFGMQSTDGIDHRIRYRLIPFDRGPESGLPSDSDKVRPWIQKRLPEEIRPKTYLRDEFAKRVNEEPVKYSFEAQIRPASECDESALNSSLEWDPKEFPWHVIGAVTLNSSLSPDETEKLCFNIANHPDSLSVLTASSPEDPNSLGAIRILVYQHSQAIRGHSKSAK